MFFVVGVGWQLSRVPRLGATGLPLVFVVNHGAGGVLDDLQDTAQIWRVRDALEFDAEDTSTAAHFLIL